LGTEDRRERGANGGGIDIAAERNDHHAVFRTFRRFVEFLDEGFDIFKQLLRRQDDESIVLGVSRDGHGLFFEFFGR
jgi:hypothetical protein